MVKKIINKINFQRVFLYTLLYLVFFSIGYIIGGGVVLSRICPIVY